MMYKELKKIELSLEITKQRNFKIITPCCSKSNKDGKFVNFKGLSECFGYCHSCGKTTLPPTQYVDENDNRYQWDELESKFIPSVFQTSYKGVGQTSDKSSFNCMTLGEKGAALKKYVENEVVERYLYVQHQNNLLSYITSTFGEKKKDFVKNLYKLGTTKDGGIIFWNINKEQKVQKAKVVYYTKEGKRKNKFKVPYKNEDGYYSCLFGEHLLGLPEYKSKPIILVESEKTAVICAINFPRFNWLSYGGINGMTNEKMNVLEGESILIIPDLSENARNITLKKIGELKLLNIDAKMWDVSNGMTDAELKEQGFYNFDLEDFLKNK